MNLDNTAVYVISVAAELSGMHPQTLRIYERRGLLQPARTPGGRQRRYSNADIGQLRRIAELANLGMNLEGIKQVMALELEIAQLRNEISALKFKLSQVGNIPRFGLVSLRKSGQRINDQEMDSGA